MCNSEWAPLQETKALDATKGLRTTTKRAVILRQAGGPSVGLGRSRAYLRGAGVKSKELKGPVGRAVLARVLQTRLLGHL